VLANGRISLRVRPEVSELSSQGSVSFGGYVIPSLTTRRAETTIELGSGQSFMIAGLMRNGAQNQLQKLPGAGDIPILGTLFRSTKFQRDETELVIVVTPYLVNPVNANEIKLPTDGYQSPNDLQRLLGNMDSDGKSGGRPTPTVAPAAGNPPLGAADPAQLIQQAQADEAGKGKKRKESKGNQTASAVPTPGFNLN
jgi:pilus assembly protein CpaC